LCVILGRKVLQEREQFMQSKSKKRTKFWECKRFLGYWLDEKKVKVITAVKKVSSGT
jgi:hypothetical protein